jgi:hypothetical protein
MIRKVNQAMNILEMTKFRLRSEIAEELARVLSLCGYTLIKKEEPGPIVG